MLFVSPALATAQPTASLSTAYTTPSYLGGLMSVKVRVGNLGSVVARVSRVEVHFDWSQVFTGNVPIMVQPGETHEWSFSDCPIPEHTWTGKHSYDITVLVAWADSSGGWRQDVAGILQTEFTVEQPPPPDVYTFSGATLVATIPVSGTTSEIASGHLIALLLLGLLFVGAIVAITIQNRRPPVRTETILNSKSTWSGAVEAGAVKECRVCHNVNPPHAKRYCVKCGSKLG